MSLLDSAIEVLQLTGFERQKALRIISNLASGTLNNIKVMDTIDALTGPIARGDEYTVGSHIQTFNKKDLTETKKIV